ncbi:MAG: DEAD/DEAH box helicase [Alphaproteobacteria bacterium]|nr:DEAD/DEAH box helicase [Alphaproteobacteria bacterium]
MTSFTDLGLAADLCRAVDAEGYVTPTPIQAGAIPALLQGRDLLGIAQTGTGKTAAFALPVLQRLSQENRRAMPRSPRALILTPTRELALQIAECFQTYGRQLNLRHAVIFGGVGQGPQVTLLARGVDVLVATPGRLLDLMQQGHLRLSDVSVFILDEADRMLDMGFVRDVRKIVAAVPAKRQTMLFSATMPQEVTALANSLMSDPVRVEVTPPSTTVERIEQRVMFVTRDDKRHLLVNLLKAEGVGRAIVFTRTKHGANRVAEQLCKMGVPADAIHGNKSQNARQRALGDFRSGVLRTLVATDIAARGIDVDGITHVINFDLPVEPEAYVHRIGRTARAGAAGQALSFCDHDEVPYLQAIEKTIRRAVPVDHDHAWHAHGVAGRHAANQAAGRGSVRRGDRPSSSPSRSNNRNSSRSHSSSRFSEAGART